MGNADVNNASANGLPVFLLACEQAQDCEGMCLSILERGADPNVTNQVPHSVYTCIVKHKVASPFILLCTYVVNPTFILMTFTLHSTLN